jgi:pimeloyl-ACP methyl ester carboxylesterase
MTHLDYDWASRVWSHWWRALSEGRLLVRYDERGCGLSDWAVDVSSFTLDAWVNDLETVTDTLGLDRFPCSASHKAVRSPSPTLPGIRSE